MEDLGGCPGHHVVGRYAHPFVGCAHLLFLLALGFYFYSYFAASIFLHDQLRLSSVF